MQITPIRDENLNEWFSVNQAAGIFDVSTPRIYMVMDKLSKKYNCYFKKLKLVGSSRPLLALSRRDIEVIEEIFKKELESVSPDRNNGCSRADLLYRIMSNMAETQINKNKALDNDHNKSQADKITELNKRVDELKKMIYSIMDSSS